MPLADDNDINRICRGMAGFHFTEQGAKKLIGYIHLATERGAGCPCSLCFQTKAMVDSVCSGKSKGSDWKSDPDGFPVRKS